MRWHVELNDTGSSLHVEHVDDSGVALNTARELAGSTHGGHKGIPAEDITRVVGQLADEDLADVEPGGERIYEIGGGLSVIVAGLHDADDDQDCWRCAQEVEAEKAKFPLFRCELHRVELVAFVHERRSEVTLVEQPSPLGAHPIFGGLLGWEPVRLSAYRFGRIAKDPAIRHARAPTR